MGSEKVGIAILITLFVAVVVALALFPAIAGNTAGVTATRNLVNYTVTAPASGSVIDVVGQELLSTPIVTNATSGAIVPTTNYTIAESVSSVDGLKRISYTGKASAYAGKQVNISYTYGPEGYPDDAGSRSIVNIIVLLAALALAAVVASKAIGYFNN